MCECYKIFKISYRFNDILSVLIEMAIANWEKRTDGTINEFIFIPYLMKSQCYLDAIRYMYIQVYKMGL